MNSILNDLLSALYKNFHGTAAECNAWEWIHVALGCEECIKKKFVNEV